MSASERKRELSRRRSRKDKLTKLKGKLGKATQSEKTEIARKLRDLTPGAEQLIADWKLIESDRQRLCVPLAAASVKWVLAWRLGARRGEWHTNRRSTTSLAAPAARRHLVMRFSVSKAVARNLLEFALLFALWAVMLEAIAERWAAARVLVAIVLFGTAAKTLFFGVENIGQLRRASDENMAYHKFLTLMLMNVWQVIASFALDYHLLELLRKNSFAGINPELTKAPLVFEFFYYSALNFMFFGYGDITPQSIPAKMMTLTEITLAFVTVIFLLSDFISLKESLRRPPSNT